MVTNWNNRWLRYHGETDEAGLGWIGSQVSTHHSRNRIQGEEVREQEQQGVPIQVRRPEEKKESEGQVISQDTRQINLKVVESGKGSLAAIIGGEEAAVEQSSGEEE
ncbi:MAG: hypothetical protein Ct9H90mP24_7610 [Methanobacteriota archaeon]|nr:MAG: hypothetical protein Ct9H90mP24_7610 [Euryarchaeota archaeon]